MATCSVPLTVDRAKELIDKIATTLKEHSESTNLVCNEVIKGGSMGQGTTVPGNFDVDLVIYSETVSNQPRVRSHVNPRQKHKYIVFMTATRKTKPFIPRRQTMREATDSTLYSALYYLVIQMPTTGIDKEELVKNGIKENLEKIHRYLKLHLTEYHLETFTKHSLQFSLQQVEIDLLLCPHWKSKEDYYNYLEHLKKSRQEDKFDMLSSSASKWQVEFVKSQPPEVIEYIKRAKAWRKKTKEMKSLTKSYLIVLLVIKACEVIRAKENPLVPVEFRIQKELEFLAKDKHLMIYWTYHYNEERIRKFQHQPPYIIDPANPCNNLYQSGINNSIQDISYSWHRIHGLIQQLDLRLPLQTGENSYQSVVTNLTSYLKQTHLTACVSTLTVSGSKRRKKCRKNKQSSIKSQMEVQIHLPLLNYFKYSELQKRFIDEQPEEVRHYIRHMKAWRHVLWDKQGITWGRPSAYLMSVLLIKAYQISRNQSSVSVELCKLIKRSKREVICLSNTDYAPPYVADPVDPSNNLYRTGITKKPHGNHNHWGRFRLYAHTIVTVIG